MLLPQTGVEADALRQKAVPTGQGLLVRLREWVTDAVTEYLDGFFGAASDWLKWRICDYIWAAFLLYW